MNGTIEILSVTELLRDLDLSSGALFRGEAKLYDSPCEPLGFRGGDYDDGRGYLIDPIMQRVDAWRKEVGRVEGRPLVSTTDLEHMILAQHYGVATRLLDWTLNPIVACWFSASKKPDEDGYIYVYEEDEEIFIQSEETLREQLAVQPQEEQSDRAIALLINPFNANSNRGQGKLWNDVHFFQPPFLPDSRILSQSGVVSIHPKPKSFDLSRLAKTYKFSASVKKDLCKEIEVLGVNARTLGLATRDSISESINNKKIRALGML